MVFLNSCHGGVHDGQAASLAEDLLRAGVPSVLAMQTTVSDRYASQLALRFYKALAQQGDSLLPSRALAYARKELEQERQAEAARGGPELSMPPEYASAALFVAHEDGPLADFGRDKEPLRMRPVHHVAGPVPQLKVDDLIGRRRELRLLLRTLRSADGQHVGAVLTGLGGSGKSTVAGRAMQRLAEHGWLVAAHAGRFDLTEVAMAVGLVLAQSGRGNAKVAEMLLRPDLDDRLRFPLLKQVLETGRVALVLDDFEQNLELGGNEFLDPGVADFLAGLARSARTGRLLLTSRYPVPDTEAYLAEVPIGPLSPAETRKLALRLPALREASERELSRVLRAIGGHPRMLEFLDALLRGGRGRLPHVTETLHRIAKELGLGLKADESLDASVAAALSVGARDVFLTELLDVARSEGIDEVLLQASCSNLPVTPAGVARMLAGGEDDDGDVGSVDHATERLVDLSLMVGLADGEVWVHRWTAQGLASVSEVEVHRERFRRAGRYRLWRNRIESRSFGDGVEAVRNFLAGEDFDSAAEVGEHCLHVLQRAAQTTQVATLATEVLEALPKSHSSYARIADAEAKARLALGQSDRALMRYRELLAILEPRAQGEPNRADYKRDVSVSYIKVGDIYRDMGQGEQARQLYLHSLVIMEALAQGEPNRTDYQRDLSVSYNKLGDLYHELGQAEEARKRYVQSLRIRKRLARAQPDRADNERGLSRSYECLGDVYRDMAQLELARLSYVRSLRIRQRLARAEPNRADYQRDLSVCHNKVGDLYRVLGQSEQARESFVQALAIADHLAQAEPDRADYQRDLSVAYEHAGDLYSELGERELARLCYRQSLEIRERLAEAEPERADYQRDVWTSLRRLGLLEQSAQHLQRALEIAESLCRTGRMAPRDEPFLIELRMVAQERGTGAA
jgi:tetratricopeptide (TPR) repeat protein